MNNVFLSSVIAVGVLAFTGCATTPEPPGEPVSFEKIYQMDNLKQGQIYDGARQWFATSFRSANAVIQYEDKTTGSIIGKGNMPYMCVTISECMIATPGERVDFTVRIDTKENRMRVTYSDLTHYKPARVVSGVRYNESYRTITEELKAARVITERLNKSSDEMAEKIKTQQKINSNW